MKSPVFLPLHEWSGLRSELVWIYDQPVAEASRKQANNRQGEHHAWLLGRGHCRFEHAKGNFLLKPGNWFFVPSGRARHEFSRDARLLSIRFLHRWPSGESFIRNDKGLQLKASQYPELEKRARRLASLVRNHFPGLTTYKVQSSQETDGQVFLKLQSTFLSWLESWLEINLQQGLEWRRLRSGDVRLLKAARHLDDSPLDKSYPRRQLQLQSGLSEIHLTRLFLNEFGLTPRKYWDRRKLEFAQDKLTSSWMPVKEIAWRLGFKSDSHFAVWFKRLSSKRPGAFRDLPSAQGSHEQPLRLIKA